MRLRFDQDRAFKADLVLVFHHLLQEASCVFALGLKVGVEQRLIALAPAPKHVIRAAQLVGGIQIGFHHGRRIGVNVRIGVGGSTAHPAAVREHIGRAPKQFGLMGRLFLGQIVNHCFKVAIAFGKGGTFGAHIGIVEAVEGHAQDIKHLKGGVGFQLGQFHRLAKPRAQQGLAAKGVVALIGKGMPVGDGKAQMIFHPLAHDHFVGVVVVKGEFVG